VPAITPAWVYRLPYCCHLPAPFCYRLPPACYYRLGLRVVPFCQFGSAACLRLPFDRSTTAVSACLHLPPFPGHLLGSAFFSVSLLPFCTCTWVLRSYCRLPALYVVHTYRSAATLFAFYLPAFSTYFLPAVSGLDFRSATYGFLRFCGAFLLPAAVFWILRSAVTVTVRYYAPPFLLPLLRSAVNTCLPLPLRIPLPPLPFVDAPAVSAAVRYLPFYRFCRLDFLRLPGYAPFLVSPAVSHRYLDYACTTWMVGFVLPGSTVACGFTAGLPPAPAAACTVWSAPPFWFLPFSPAACCRLLLLPPHLIFVLPFLPLCVTGFATCRSVSATACLYAYRFCLRTYLGSAFCCVLHLPAIPFARLPLLPACCCVFFACTCRRAAGFVLRYLTSAVQITCRFLDFAPPFCRGCR